MDDFSLAAEFPAATREGWLKLVEGVLKGADFEKRLVSRTYDGLKVEPLYPKAEDAPRIGRATPGRWRVAQRVDHPDPAQANPLALADLEGGADALTVVTRKAPAARGFGLAVDTLDALDRALADVMLDLVHLRLDAGGRGRQTAALLVALAERRGHRLADLSIDLGLDPIGAMSAGGVLSASWETVATRCAETLHALQAREFPGGTFLADGRPAHEAGAGEAQELAIVLATALAYLRALEAGGHGLDAARCALSFLLVADADEFLTIAKMRALRRLWSRVEEACGLSPQPIRLHAETAWRMTTRRDPWVNLLRATVATFSAGIGGADFITVLPFTAALGLPDAFARRLARNTQHILLEEANLWRVADPAAGAGGFEALTDALCDKAWALFQEIEREGGIVESLAGGTLQDRVAAVRARRESAAATRKDPITGVSEFPNIHEAPVSVLIPSPDAQEGARTAAGGAQLPAVPGRVPAEPASLGAGNTRGGAGFDALVAEAREGASLAALASTAQGDSPLSIPPLPSTRTAEPYERLRDRADAHRARTGERPKVFLANLGPIATFTARASFAKNFFEAGGIEAVTNEGFNSLDLMLNAYLASKARLLCVCGSDETYKDQLGSTINGLRAASKSPIYVACRPGVLEVDIKRAGATIIFAGCDTLTILSEALEAACA
jgi:methylmalonyl-CoA mutase